MPDYTYLSRETIRAEALHFFKQDFPNIPQNHPEFSKYFGVYRHVYGSAVLTREFKALAAEALGNANEFDFYGLRDNPPLEKNQDLWNNAVGRKIGEGNPTGRDIADKIKQSFDNGDVIINIETDDRIYEKDVVSLSVHVGYVYTPLAYSGVIRSDALPLLEQSITNIEDNEGNQFSIVKNVLIPLKDGSVAALHTIIETIDSAKQLTEQFLSNYTKELTDLFSNGEGIASLISDVATQIQRGKALGWSNERIVGEIAQIVAIKAAVRVLAKEAVNHIVFNASDLAIINSNDVSQLRNLSAEGQHTLNMLQTSNSYKFAYNVGVAYTTTIILNIAEGWDSREYGIAAVQATAQVASQMAVSYFMHGGATSAGTAGGAAGAGYAGVAAAAAYMASTLVSDLFASDHLSAHQWQSAMVSAAVIGVAAAIGFFAGGPVGSVIATTIVSQFMGGKEYNAGEYPDPYSFINIIAKADGSGNIIQGLEAQGVVAMARENYNDDLYGTVGADNLIGRSGSNIIMGYEGNDHLEGRGNADLLIGGQGNDEIFGGDGNDKIYGSEGNDNLFGGAGDDIIIGGTGSSINGSSATIDGNDFIQAGDGDDNVMAEAGNDEIQGNNGNDIIIAGEGDDRAQGNDGDDTILGENGDDIILGQDGSDILDGGAGNDYLEGGDGNDNISGGDNNDVIFGQAGVDIIHGDAGSDVINAGSDNDLVFAGLGDDVIYGGDGNDTISGEFGNDYLIGANGADTIEGGVGDDVLMGGAGNDILKGGEGNDTFIYRIGDGADTITEDGSSGHDTLKLSGINSKLSNNATNKLVLTKSGNDLIIQFKNDLGNIISGDQITVANQFATSEKILKTIEFADGRAIDLTNIQISDNGSISYTAYTYANIDTTIQEELALGYNDIMQLSEEQINPSSTYNSNNYSSSGEQEDIVHEQYNQVEWNSLKKKRNMFGGHYNVWYKYYEQNLNGTNGNDRLVGHWWDENIYGGNGADQQNGNDGNDNLYGGAGNDIMHGGAGSDNIRGEAGQDLIFGGTGNDTINGGDDNDTIYANDGDDNIIGGAGDDYIEGNNGNDIINDNQGNNIIIAGAGNDIITTGSGNDKIEGGAGGDTINAGDGNNLIYGNGGSDTITSGSGNDTIYGQEDNDLINSGAGDDYVSGGSGNDTLNGGDGNDTIFGDLGNDLISGGSGVDYIYGGLGVDIINGDAGNDYIKGGDSDDVINGGADNDKLYGESGSDKIYGDSGNDEIEGGLGGDVLEGGIGNDIIRGGLGNDILVDGEGSDILDAGPVTTGVSGTENSDSDILILTKERGASNSIDTIKNWNKAEDKIILKVNYQTPITFADIQSHMRQNGSNVEIALDNGQKIIIENITISDITSTNFQIGLSGGVNNDILFGTNGEDIIFGDAGDDKIYGGEGNDELWGGKGSDELYGQGGNDILRYEADGKYLNEYNKNYFTSSIVYFQYLNPSGTRYNYWPVETIYEVNPNGSTTKIREITGANNSMTVTKPMIQVGEQMNSSSSNSDIFSNDLVSRITVTNPFRTVRDINSGGAAPWYVLRVLYEYKIDYTVTIASEFKTKNFFNNQLANINGYNRTFDKFIGGAGINTILMTEGNDVLALDDPTSPNGSNSSTQRVQDISVIHAGGGDDIINFSSPKYSYGDLVVYGGTGNDKIWLSGGSDYIFGGEGNDEIYAGEGVDTINGGSGDDIIYGWGGNDIIEGGSGINRLFGDSGDDLFIAGAGADTMHGDSGLDTISYINSVASVNINLANGSTAGGSANNNAANDVFTSIENIIGSAFNDTLNGNSYANMLNGGAGNDIISGYDGNDFIIGGQGFDVMTGGRGNDQFIFTDKLDSSGSFSNLSETDTILDFTRNQDKIVLSNLGFNSITQGQGSNHDTNGLEFYFKDGYTVIDDPNSDFAIKLQGQILLQNSDFVF